MNNRFDEMVFDAVNEVETSLDSPPEPVASNKAKQEPQKVVSIDAKSDSSTESPKRKAKREPKGVGESDAAATLARGLTRPLVTKTVRFRPELAEALNRIVLENKLAGHKPDTIQEVVNEAAEAWVKAYKARY